MKKLSTRYTIILLLLIIFTAPGVGAYLFYQHPSWLGLGRVNKGTLLNPPVQLNALEGNSKWSIVFWNPGECDKSCIGQLNTLAKVRLALGRKLYQVDQWLILGDKAPSLSPEQQSIVQEMDFKVAQLPAAEALLFSEAKAFIADPGNYLILSYSSPMNPEDVYKDLELLLKTTKNKSD